MKFLNKGLTLIEIMIIIAIIGIGISILLPVFNPEMRKNTSFGHNGLVEHRCINGYKHTVGPQGFVQQTIGENGGGVRCD